MDASSAGLYKTDLGVSIHDVPEAIRRCWASLWEEQVFSYLNRNRAMDRAPAMAVVIQPMIAARVSGVAFSRHPVSTRDDVLINAVPGLGESLVSGRSVPDEYVVSRPETGCAGKVLERRLARRSSMAILGASGLVAAQLTEAESVRPSLMDQEIMVLASVVSEVERVLGQPVDVEWVFDQDDLWILQARPASSQGDAADAPNRRYQWSRANFKETLPEVPSPLSLSF